MSSNLDRRAGLAFGLKLTLWYALFFAVAGSALYFLSTSLIRNAMEHDWQLNQTRFEERWRGHAGETGYAMMTSKTQAFVALPPAVRNRIEQHFADTFPVLVIPILVLALGGGFILTFLTTRPLRSLAHTVRTVLQTGELDRRVPTKTKGGELHDLILLFNRLLEQNETLVRVMRESLDNVAHDLRTPITRLRAVAETALGEASSADSQREALADCMEESEQILRLVASLMDVAEAEAGTMRLDVQDTALRPIVDAVVDLYEFVAEDKNIRLVAEVPESLRLPADADRLRQVLVNLVDNAVKYSPNNSVVTIGAQESGSRAKITVSDQGPGIPVNEQPRIWDRLYRGDQSRSAPGLGLGLALVRAIVAAHHGSVSVDSKPGGATFTVDLPLTG